MRKPLLTIITVALLVPVTSTIHAQVSDQSSRGNAKKVSGQSTPNPTIWKGGIHFLECNDHPMAGHGRFSYQQPRHSNNG